VPHTEAGKPVTGGRPDTASGCTLAVGTRGGSRMRWRARPDPCGGTGAIRFPTAIREVGPKVLGDINWGFRVLQSDIEISTASAPRQHTRA